MLPAVTGQTKKQKIKGAQEMNTKRWLMTFLVVALILASFPTVALAAPAAPPNFRLDRAFTISLMVTWDKPAYAVKEYIVYKNGAEYKRTGTVRFCLVDKLTAATSYSLYVKAVDTSGNVSSPSPTIVVSTKGTSKKFYTMPIAGANAQGYFEDVGIDFYANQGTNCVAVADGKVKVAG